MGTVEIYVLLNFFIYYYAYIFHILIAYVNLRAIMDNKIYPLPLNGLLNYKSRSKRVNKVSVHPYSYT
jgi:hypothetical protein